MWRLPSALRLGMGCLCVLAPACQMGVVRVLDAGPAERDEGEGGGEGEGDCGREPIPGLTATVEDTQTLFPICDASVTITEGGFRETLVPVGSSPDCAYEGAQNRPGTYAVVAEKTGYLPYSVTNIKVEPSECGLPVPRALSLRLTPASP